MTYRPGQLVRIRARLRLVDVLSMEAQYGAQIGVK